jgi:DNA-binding XRE family transcriptional regulator
MLQREVAEQLGVDKTCVFNWEGNRSNPEIRYMPEIIRFLGYNPLPAAATMGERLIRHRTMLGLSQGDAARELDVDPSTLAKWERGEREPAGAFAKRAERDSWRLPAVNSNAGGRSLSLQRPDSIESAFNDPPSEGQHFITL